METWGIYNVQYDGKSTYINTVIRRWYHDVG